MALDEKWIREEGDLGGKKNPLADNMLEAYAFFAFYDSVDRSFSTEDLQIMIDTAMGKSIRTLSHFNLNKLLKHRWIVRLIYRHLESYQKKNYNLPKSDNHRAAPLCPPEKEKAILGALRYFGIID